MPARSVTQRRKATRKGAKIFGWRALPLMAAAALCAAAIALPLWGMTLVSTQYPDGLRMVVYPTRIVGDITELNLLNHYIGMAPITNEFFSELRVLPVLLASVAALCLFALVFRRWWSGLLPLGGMVAIAVYGFYSMTRRLYQFGHDLDPAAPIDIEPFTPPMFGQNQIAQFATWSYFSWGTFLPVLAGLLVMVVIVRDWRARA